MEVLDPCAAWLCNFEVLRHLQEQKAQRDRISATLGRPVRGAENMLTVEFETLEYLSKTETTAKMNENKLEQLMTYLKGFALTKAEKLQIVNMLPKTQVEFYLIVEECEERFTTDKVTSILEMIATIDTS